MCLFQSLEKMSSDLRQGSGTLSLTVEAATHLSRSRDSLVHDGLSGAPTTDLPEPPPNHCLLPFNVYCSSISFLSLSDKCALPPASLSASAARLSTIITPARNARFSHRFLGSGNDQGRGNGTCERMTYIFSQLEKESLGAGKNNMAIDIATM